MGQKWGGGQVTGKCKCVELLKSLHELRRAQGIHVCEAYQAWVDILFEMDKINIGFLTTSLTYGFIK